VEREEKRETKDMFVAIAVEENVLLLRLLTQGRRNCPLLPNHQATWPTYLAN
jgi:hypothetical protein